MGEATWLASYPKSGNTWTRAFLIALTGDRCEVNINGLGKISIASSAAPFEFAAGIRVSDLTEDEIERLRPEVHRFLVEMADGHCFFKAHDAYIFTDEGVPLFPTSVTRGAVYLLRNPLDVAVSWANHGNIPLREAVAQLNSVNLRLAFRSPGGALSHQLRQRMLTWGEHVVSWVDAEQISVLPIRYEDIKADAVREFSKIVAFTGLSKTREEIMGAEAACRFEKLKQQEEEHGFREKRSGCGRFFHRGQSGCWREELTDAQASAIIEHNGDVMRRFGYLDDKGNPV